MTQPQHPRDPYRDDDGGTRPYTAYGPRQQGGAHDPAYGRRPYDAAYTDRDTRYEPTRNVRPMRVEERFDLPGLARMAAIIAVIAGIVYGLAAWVVDLATQRIADAAGHDAYYTLIGTTGGYVVFGVIGAVSVLAGFTALIGLYAGVNDPEGAYRWLMLVVPLGCLISGLTLVSPWSWVPVVVLIVVAALPLWLAVPARTAAYDKVAGRGN